MEGNSQVILASVVFLLTYAIIISEKIHRTVIALVGAMIFIITGILNQEEAIHHIDFNTIGLLVGMMVIVGITRQSGVFEYLAVKSAKYSKGEPLAIMVALSLITAVLSALLDNVTTVLLIVPVTFSIARSLEINPMPILLAEILASNIGGTSTLIGDPPNIMIGSAVGLGFMDFVVNLLPVVVVIMIVTIFLLKMIYKNSFNVREELKKNIMDMNENDEIKDHKLLKQSLFVLAVTIGGFLLHQSLHLESATVALAGAALLLLITRQEPEHALEAVEWPVIFFFAGLFILVGGLVEVGIIEWIAAKALEITGGELLTTGMLILWLSAIASAFVDNIPFVATMIPLIQDMGRLGGMTNLDPLWWSLSLGACLGGNGTIIGASANVVVIGMAEKQGVKFTFLGFMKVAFPLMIVSIIISSIYLYFFYLT
ncbi:ArsB/NhaD family transporter [Desulfotomaculum defluvii]